MEKQNQENKNDQRKRDLDATLARRKVQEKKAHTHKPITSDTDPFFTEEDAEENRRREATVVVDN